MAVSHGTMDEDFARAASDLTAYLADSASLADPYPTFRQVRDVEPVHWSEAGTWVILGHAEAREAYRHPTLSRQGSAEHYVRRFGPRTGAEAEALQVYLAAMFSQDGVGHFRIRSLVARAFGPREILRWEHVIADTVESLLNEVLARDAFDVLHDFAYPIPSRVICQMVGVPHADHDLFEKWTAAWLDTNVSDTRTDLTQASLSPLIDFFDYLRDLIADRRRSSADDDDLVTLLLKAGDSGKILSDHELIAAIYLLISAGHETTANLISNGTIALLNHDEQFDLLRRSPELAASAVEEFLRFDCPARSQPRLATEDLEIGGVTISAGQPVQALIAAVNHDGRVFEHPDVLDITRTDNPHVGFGYGAHFCLGLHIARLEARYAVAALARMGELDLAGELVWRSGHIRGVQCLPVTRR